MASIDKNSFLNPELKYRVRPMLHAVWSNKQYKLTIDALKDYGYGGVVTNPPSANGFFADDENIDEFKNAVAEIRKQGFSYWVYDEHGYPSGYANGRTLIGHPELAAKGFYMIRRIAYEPRHTTFTIDDETDKIIWAAKYPVEIVNVAKSLVQFDKMIPIPFTDTYCECDLKQYEALFIFCSKTAHEGSHCTHNVCSHAKYINIMDERAVRRFIDLTYQKIANRFPDAYKYAEAVFTDEPSLQTSYNDSTESWPYALAPWVDGLFEEYEKEYGTSLLPYLPLIFEGGTNAYPIRRNFYQLVGKIIASSYSGQLSAWCREHGTLFSGHYFQEETLLGHVENYGNYVEVLKAADYPGIDVLACIPEAFNYNTAKFAQIVARKKATNGMMVELCPFLQKPTFAKDPWNNISAVSGTLALCGVRIFNSYFKSDLSDYDKNLSVVGNCYKGRDEARSFNEYVGRLTYMLDGVLNDCNTFVYYCIEDVQAQIKPKTCSSFAPWTHTDASANRITKSIFESGFDFYYADCDDLVNARESLKNGTATISGCEVKTVIIPSIDVLDSRSFAALIELQNAAVKIAFLDKLPSYICGGEDGLTPNEHFKALSEQEILSHLEATDNTFTAHCDNAMLLKGRFIKDGKEIYLVCNNTRDVDATVTFNHKEKTTANIYSPIDGSVTPINMGESHVIPAFRCAFVVFD